MITMMCPTISRMLLRRCNWVNKSGLDYFCYKNLKRKQVSALDPEDLLRTMGSQLRTNVKEGKKSEYRGKEDFSLSLEASAKKFNMNKRKQVLSSFKYGLKEIDISGCKSISEETVIRLIEVFNNLEVLRIGENPLISNICMKEIARKLRKLLTLDIR